MRHIKEIVFSILLLCITLEMFSQSPRFSFSKDSIVVLETTEDFNFKVYKGLYTSPSGVVSKSIIGSFSHNDGATRFIPLLPFQKGKDYTVVSNDDVYSFMLAVDSDYAHLEVETMYPNIDVLPSNFLKWYIHFSKSVNPANIYDHIYLLDTSNNTKVDRALLSLETPLLSDDGKLLTLWVEPGRQKRDLGPNRELGEVLVSGKSYTLVIESDLKDMEGISMIKKFEYSFKVTDADRTKPTITSWEVNIPKPNTKETLRISIDEYIDYGSLKDGLTIVDASEKIIEGNFTINSNQKFVLFKPAQKWDMGGYTIKCNPIIEDLAGNNLERLFDRDVTVEKVEPVLEMSFVIE